jgi:dTDP-4-dehydrorhamnose 3,5-epimerase
MAVPFIAPSAKLNKDPIPLQRIETSLPGVLELHPKVFPDARGFFLETFHLARFRELRVTETFVQDNHSCSRKGTLRGLHYQLRHPQAKLCRVVEGQVLDVVLDVREGSPYFGKWTSVLLSAERQNQVYVPAGFAHGFLALTDTVQFLYKCSDYYHPEDEYGVLWNDPELKISWGIVSPVVSERDAKLPSLVTIPKECLPRYTGA